MDPSTNTRSSGAPLPAGTTSTCTPGPAASAPDGAAAWLPFDLREEGPA